MRLAKSIGISLITVLALISALAFVSRNQILDFVDHKVDIYLHRVGLYASVDRVISETENIVGEKILGTGAKALCGSMVEVRIIGTNNDLMESNGGKAVKAHIGSGALLKFEDVIIGMREGGSRIVRLDANEFIVHLLSVTHLPIGDFNIRYFDLVSPLEKKIGCSKKVKINLSFLDSRGEQVHKVEDLTVTLGLFDNPYFLSNSILGMRKHSKRLVFLDSQMMHKEENKWRKIMAQDELYKHTLDKTSLLLLEVREGSQ